MTQHNNTQKTCIAQELVKNNNRLGECPFFKIGDCSFKSRIKTMLKIQQSESSWPCSSFCPPVMLAPSLPPCWLATASHLPPKSSLLLIASGCSHPSSDLHLGWTAPSNACGPRTHEMASCLLYKHRSHFLWFQGSSWLAACSLHLAALIGWCSCQSKVAFTA